MNIGPLVAIVPVVLAVAMIILIIRRNVTGRSESISRDITAAIPAIVVLMVAALLIGSFASTVDKNTYELYECVPLSEFGSNATIDGDCAEVVTIGGEQYVRMTDIGTFTASSGSQTKDYNVVKANMDLVLIAGQSNCYYYTNPSLYDGPTTVAPGKAFYLGSGEASGNFAGIPRQEVSGSLDSAAITDYVASDGTVSVAGMYPTLCGDYVQETGHRVLVVNTGVGGKQINNWDNGGLCDTWVSDVLDKVSDLVSDESVVLTPTVAMWSQGYSDAFRSAQYYTGRLVPLIEKFQNGYYGYEFDDVLSVLPRYETGNPTGPAVAQEAVASSNPHFTIASSLPPHFTTEQMQDGAHYSQQSYRWLGEAFARSAAEVMGYRPVSETLTMRAGDGVFENLPSTVEVYGTSGEAYEVSARWTSTQDPSVFRATLSRAPSGTVLPSGLSVEGYPCNPELFTYDATGTVITGLSSAGAGATHIVIPTSHNGASVSWIESSAFINNTDIVLVATLDDSSLAGVRVSAFKGCTGLVVADLPDTAAAYGNYAFQGCTSLESVDIPDGTTTLPNMLYDGCTSLKSVHIPGSVTTLGNSVFRGCTGTAIVSFDSGFNATMGTDPFAAWTFYASDGSTVIDKTVASNLAGHTFKGSADHLVMYS